VERVLARILGIDSELPDLVNDVFVNALGSLHTLRASHLLRPWLRSVTVFVARGCLRRRRRRRWLSFHRDEDLPEVATHDAPAAAADALARLYRLLNRLPPDECIVFALRFIEEMELAEIADACGVSRTTIKRRVKKAETRFTEEARKDPLLSEWMAKGDRWNVS
jgi:RNA polymerase sigma-70 factor (ECF subfamily)